MNENVPPTSLESRVEKLEAEVRGLRKFVTTLETGHESRAKGWNKRFAFLTAEIDDLKSGVKKARNKIKKLKR